MTYVTILSGLMRSEWRRRGSLFCLKCILRRRWIFRVVGIPNLYFASALDFPGGGLKVHFASALDFPGGG